jgi:hypothetical protein
VEEFVALYPGDYIPRANAELNSMPQDKARALAMNWPDTNPKIWETLEKWLPGLGGFEFFGGEPFLNRRHLEFLKKSVAAGHSRQQSLHYNTNGTVYPEFAVKHLFPHFKRVSIFFSIDGLESQFEYQRFGAKWPLVLENLLKIRANTQAFVGIGMSVNIMNIFYLPEFLEFWRHYEIPVFLNPVYEPAHFDIRALPPGLKKKVYEKLSQIDASRFEKTLLSELEGLKAMMRSADNSSSWPDFLLSTHRHDHYRQEKFSATFPELYELFTQSEDWQAHQSNPHMTL